MKWNYIECKKREWMKNFSVLCILLFLLSQHSVLNRNLIKHLHRFCIFWILYKEEFTRQLYMELQIISILIFLLSWTCCHRSIDTGILCTKIRRICKEGKLWRALYRRKEWTFPLYESCYKEVHSEHSVL